MPSAGEGQGTGFAQRQDAAGVQAEVAALARRLALLDETEQAHWAEHHGLVRRAAIASEERAAVETSLAVACRHLDRLKKTNVFNDAFHIWSVGC